ncbi:MAG: carboxymuconolactone decarboxylase family protein [Gammaproteobacteria bacterium]
MHPDTRTDYRQQSPALYRKFTEFGMAVHGDPALDAGIAHLVDLRASQLNGCAFCVDMHVKEARLHGDRELRLHHVAIWRESPLFDARERAALAWTEALTRLGPDGIPDALYAEVAAQFAPDALVALTWRVVAINGWNRANIAFRTAPGSLDAVFGLERAGLR